MKKISILIPAYNEQDVLHILYERLHKLMESNSHYEWEILFVNDGSTDATIGILHQLHLKDQRIQYIDLSRNYGKEVAMMAGFDYVTGDCMVIMDADLQHPPEFINEMIKYWEEGYDDVYAKRRTRGGESFLKKKTAKVFYRLLQKISSIPIQQDTGDFRLLDRTCIDALRAMRETQRYTKGMYSWIGFKKKELLFDQQARVAGDTKWNYMGLMRLAIEGITSFTTAPLLISSIIGIIISFATFVYMIYVLFRSIIYGDPVQGYPTLMIIILFLGGVQLLSLGIIGEYLGRIFHETKNRPPYFVQSYNGQKIHFQKTGKPQQP